MDAEFSYKTLQCSSHESNGFSFDMKRNVVQLQTHVGGEFLQLTKYHISYAKIQDFLSPLSCGVS